MGERNLHQRRWDERYPSQAARREIAEADRAEAEADPEARHRKNAEAIARAQAEVDAMTMDELVDMMESAAEETRRDRELAQEEAANRKRRRYEGN